MHKETRTLLTGDEVDRRTGLSRSQRYNLMKTGHFPRGFLLCGSRRRVWDSLEIEKWIAEQVEQGRTASNNERTQK